MATNNIYELHAAVAGTRSKDGKHIVELRLEAAKRWRNATPGFFGRGPLIARTSNAVLQVDAAVLHGGLACERPSFRLPSTRIFSTGQASEQARNRIESGQKMESGLIRTRQRILHTLSSLSIVKELRCHLADAKRSAE